MNVRLPMLALATLMVVVGCATYAARTADDYDQGQAPRPQFVKDNEACARQAELDQWEWDITHHTFIHENIKTLMQAFRYDAHPMGMFISTVAALSTFYPNANKVSAADKRLARFVPKAAPTGGVRFSGPGSRGLGAT